MAWYTAYWTMNMQSAMAMPTYQCLSIARAMIWPLTGTDQKSKSEASSEAISWPPSGDRTTTTTTMTIVRMEPQAMMLAIVGTSRWLYPEIRSMSQ